SIAGRSFVDLRRLSAHLRVLGPALLICAVSPRAAQPKSRDSHRPQTGDKMTSPSAAHSTSDPFVFTFRSEMDPIAGGPPLYSTVVRVSGRSGRAQMIITRHPHDVGHPVGVFAMSMDRPTLDRF